MKEQRRILPKVIFRVLPLSAAALFLIWFGTRYIAEKALKREMNERLVTQAEQASNAISNRLNTLINTVRNLAENHLVVNGLIDMSRRSDYLPLFFQSLRIPGPADVRITMTDYRGRAIVSNREGVKGFANADWFEKAMSGGEIIRIEYNEIKIIIPILYLGLPEGLVVVEYGADHVSEILEMTLQETSFAVVGMDESVLYSSNSEFLKTGQKAKAQSIRDYLNQTAAVSGFPSLSVVCAMSKENAFSSTKRLDHYFLAAMLLDLIALFAGITLSANFVANPLSGFEKKIRKILQTGDLTHYIPETGAREFQSLARSFNEMCENLQITTVSRDQLEVMVQERTRELKATQKELVGRAMEAGRAQLSAMVLHNIGNAVTPMKMYIHSIKSDELDRMAGYMKKCYTDLEAHADDLTQYVGNDPRGKEIFSYIGNLIDSLNDFKGQSKQDIRKLDEAISYVMEVLSLQQTYAAGAQEMKEIVNLNVLIEDAVRMQEKPLEKRGIRVKKDLAPDLPKLVIDKNKLMQVLVNYIKNSYEAIEELNDDSREKRIDIKTQFESGKVNLEIKDSGIGIAPDMIDKVSEFGKSSKGSSGFGLHYCSMFMEANRGRLDISSPGSGRGTTIRLSFEPDNKE